MQLENLNLWSLIFFIIVNLFFIMLFVLFYNKREKLSQKYKLLFKKEKYFYLKYLFLLISLSILSFSILQIQYQTNIKKTYSKTDIVFALDVSQSMNSLDYQKNWIPTSRLEYTKDFIKQYILKNSSNRYSLVIFAWDAINVIPLTQNHSHLLNTLTNLNYKKISKQGSDLERAVKLSFSRLSSVDPENKKVMILFSDGGESSSGLSFLEDKESEIKDYLSFIVWVWKKTLSKIPLWKDFFWKVIYKKYNWKYVETKLNDKGLKNLASELNWKYFVIDDFENENDFSFDKLSFDSLEYESKSFSRILAIISLIFFMLYLTFTTKWKKQ